MSDDSWEWIGAVPPNKTGSGERTLDVYADPRRWYWRVLVTRGRPWGERTQEELEVLSPDRAEALGYILLAASLAADHKNPLPFHGDPDELERLHGVLHDALRRYVKDREGRSLPRPAVS